MKIGLFGSTGKLGGQIENLLVEQKLSFYSFERHFLEQAEIFFSFIKNMQESIVLLDVSLPSGTTSLCQRLDGLPDDLAKKIIGIVIGTTGHGTRLKEHLQKISKRFPLCLCSNFSTGIFLFEQILKARTDSGLSVSQLARSLGFKLGLHETHHAFKTDIPSGTALTLAEAGEIEPRFISSSRVGSVVGEHSLILSKESEEMALTHRVFQRKVFAEGAIALCMKIIEKRPCPGLLKKEDLFAFLS